MHFSGKAKELYESDKISLQDKKLFHYIILCYNDSEQF